LVEFAENEEFSMAQSGHDPPLRDLHAHLDFGLGEKRVLQTVMRVEYKFSLSRILSIH
jgi:hypothetical protein